MDRRFNNLTIDDLLDACAELLKTAPLVTSESRGLFISRLPKPRERYLIMLPPSHEVAHENIYQNGTTVLTIKRREKEE